MKKLEIDFHLLAESVRNPKLTLAGAALMLKMAFEQAMRAEEGFCANPRVEHCGPHPRNPGCAKWESQ